MSDPRDPNNDLLRHIVESRLRRMASASIDRRTFLRGSAAAAAGAAAMALPFRGFTPSAVEAAARAYQQTGDSADAAVAAAKKLHDDGKVSKLTMISEANLQAKDPENFSGPMWKDATGIEIEVIEKPFPELFPTMVQEHIGQTGAIDVLQIVPAWMADFVDQGIAEPLDDFIAQYGNTADNQDMHPVYQNLGTYGGKTYGFFDDGDTLVGYFRTDLFGDSAAQADYKTKTGKDLAAPTTWDEYDTIQAFFTERGGGKSWGGASQRAPSQSNHWFTQEFRVRGGKFFDSDTLDATLDSQAGVDTLTRMLASNKSMPTGVETWDFGAVLTAWLQGQLAMVGCTWPPFGRFSENYQANTPELSGMPASTVAGKVDYFVMPGGWSQMASGFTLGVSADSANKEAAYLFAQWMTSPKISLQRVMLPYSLRDPYRLSHYASEEYRSKWPNAGKYLDTLKASADKALYDIIMPGNNDYETALDQMWGSVEGGTAIADALSAANKAFNEITDRTGRDKAKAAYAEYIQKPGAYPS